MAGLRFYSPGFNRACGDDFRSLGGFRLAARLCGLRRRVEWAFLRIKANFVVWRLD